MGDDVGDTPVVDDAATVVDDAAAPDEVDEDGEIAAVVEPDPDPELELELGSELDPELELVVVCVRGQAKQLSFSQI